MIDFIHLPFPFLKAYPPPDKSVSKLTKPESDFNFLEIPMYVFYFKESLFMIL